LGLRERLILVNNNNVNNNNQERFLLLNGLIVEGSGVAASQKNEVWRNKMIIKKIRIVKVLHPVLSDCKSRSGRENAYTCTEITCARLAYVIDRAAYESIELQGYYGEAIAYVEIEDDKKNYYIINTDELDINIDELDIDCGNRNFLEIDEAMSTIEVEGELSLVEVRESRGLVWDGQNWRQVEPRYSPKYCVEEDAEYEVWGKVLFSGFGVNERSISGFVVAESWTELLSSDCGGVHIGNVLSDWEGRFLLENRKKFSKEIEIWESTQYDTLAMFCQKKDLDALLTRLRCPQCGESLGECVAQAHGLVEDHEVAAFLAGA
jgi:hypothetical protein